MNFSVWFFFFKQKTAYEISVRDWSSDVCSSDLRQERRNFIEAGHDADRQKGRHQTRHRKDLSHDPWRAVFQVGERDRKGKVSFYEIVEEADQLVHCEQREECRRTAGENRTEPSQDVSIEGGAEHQKQRQENETDE